NMFAELGVPIYNADVEAKKLTASSKIIRKKLIALLGEETFKNGLLDRKYMAEKIFSDKDLLQATNEIIHPEVAEHFKTWLSQQNTAYIIKEAAIIFESGTHSQYDLVILVTAPKKVRLDRVMSRDNATEMEVGQRMANQWSDAKKEQLADIIIKNVDLEATRLQVETIHSQLR
ncbi:MAG TPA: dephospho-CoA kinase, partial [Aequorivita sp.]|nr:dephospho-CoA kinase [Aequorivita sp.]